MSCTLEMACALCGRRLRSDNRTGYCRRHTPKVGAGSYGVCACGVRLGRDNKTGKCRRCHMALQGRKHGGKIGVANHAWTGGTTSKKGYVKVKRPNHHRADNHGYVWQHVLVVEEAMGRPIGAAECVHHVNENRSDNRPENLWVFATVGDHTAFHKSGKTKGLVWRGDGLPIPA